jgi:hypothetical protein
MKELKRKPSARIAGQRQMIPTGEQSGLQTHTATTESVLLSAPMKS